MNAPVDPPSLGSDITRLSVLLRGETQAVHAQAERSGVVRDLLRGTITRDGYALYLRNLLPVYRALETALDARRGEAAVAGVARPQLYRSAAIEADLAALCGASGSDSLLLVEATHAYVAMIEAAGCEVSGGALLAHAYVRYFGDLSGGQILRGILQRGLRLPDAALSVYDFPQIADLGQFKVELREALDAAGHRLAAPGLVVEEAILAFRVNIRVSEDVQSRLRA